MASVTKQARLTGIQEGVFIIDMYDYGVVHDLGWISR